MRAQLLPFSYVLIASFLVRRGDASCYYPDGSFPDDYVYVPCSGDEFTSCCIMSEGDQCLSNGLCYYPDGDYSYMFRGACTDKSWNSPNCFQHCKTGVMDGSYDKIVHCGDDRYCCYSDGSTCCNDDSKVFTVASASVIKDLATTTSYVPPIASATGATITGQSTGSKATNSAAAATSTSTSTSAPAQSKEESDSPSKVPLIAGAVGGVVVLVIAIGLVWFLVRRRYRKKLAAGANSQAFPMSSDGFERLPDKSPRPVEAPAPLHSPAPPYQPPAYQTSPLVAQTPPPQHNAIEIDNSYLPPGRNQWGQPVFEAPAQPYRHT